MPVWFHGSDGMGEMHYPAPKRPLASTDAVNDLVRRFREAPGEITLVTLGPLTNIALALSIEPRMAEWVKQCYVMGGAARTVGNVTGVGGKDMSKLQGQVAGLNILGKLGHLSPEETRRRVQALGPQIEREARFIGMLKDRLRVRGVKLRTRCGMGPCQGWLCESNVGHMIANLTQQPREEVGQMSIRPSLSPVLIKDILQ